MEKKIKGYVCQTDDQWLAKSDENGSMFLQKKDTGLKVTAPATLIIHPGEHEEVFTVTEVKAVLREIALLADGRTKLNQRFLAILTKHNITI